MRNVEETYRLVEGQQEPDQQFSNPELLVKQGESRPDVGLAIAICSVVFFGGALIGYLLGMLR